MTRLMARYFKLPAALCAAGFLCVAMPAQAGLFDDDVARKQVSDLQKSTSQTLIDQSRQIDQLNHQFAELRGQIEVLINQIGQLDKRQKDYYVDLDNRIQSLEAAGQSKVSPKPVATALVTNKATDKIETKPDAKVENKAAEKQDNKPAADDPAAVLTAYETALGLFKGGKYKEAVAAFDKFIKTYPDNDQAPAAQFWLGNSYYAAGDCKQAISSQQKLIAKWPKNNRAPDAMINIANCQADLGQKAESQKTLRDLVSRYPESKAAISAKQQLK